MAICTHMVHIESPSSPRPSWGTEVSESRRKNVAIGDSHCPCFRFGAHLTAKEYLGRTNQVLYFQHTL